MQSRRHYGADTVVAGKMWTSTTPFRKANKKIHRVHHFKLRQILGYKIPQIGIKYEEASESYTSILSRELLAPKLGVDIHKGAAYAFSIKVINLPAFKKLVTPIRYRVHANEGDGIPSVSKVVVSELTVPHKSSGIVCSLAKEATLQSMVEAGFKWNFRASILQVRV